VEVAARAEVEVVAAVEHPVEAVAFLTGVAGVATNRPLPDSSAHSAKSERAFF
jgi:hypothetical protein